MRIRSIQFIGLLILLVGSISVRSDEQKGCSAVSISTMQLQDGELAYDIMNRGVLNSDWEYSNDSVKDSDSTEMDFLYVTVFGKHDKLTLNNFKISTNSTLAANTTLFIEKVIDRYENKTYSIRINYKCNEDISEPIKLDFKIEGNFPNCKGSHSQVYWTRKCGDSEPPKMGLSLDFNIKHKYNRTIVENGQLIDADYFSEDYDTYVLRIPTAVQYSLFYMQLNMSEEIYTHNGFDPATYLKELAENKDDTKFKAHQLQLQKTLEIKNLSLNYDVLILDVNIKGPLINGGILTDERLPIYLEYKCKRGGISGIQLAIEMDNFKNVNIFFEKECPLQPGEGSGLLGSIAFIILILFVVVVFVTLYNVFALDIKGVKAVPFATTVLNGLSKVPGLKGSSFGNTLQDLANPSYTNTLSNDSIHAVSNQVSQEEQEFNTSEFKIKNITEKDNDEEINDATTIGTNNKNSASLGNYGSI